MELLVIPNVYGLVRPPQEPSDRILLQERWKPNTDPDNTGRLELPGGKWRAFEPALVCLRREIEEETGLRIDLPDQLQRTVSLGTDRVDVLTPPMIVQMTSGPYPSVLTVFACTATGTPKNRGDSSRNADWHEIERVREMLDSDPNRFTALTYAILQQAFDTDAL